MELKKISSIGIVFIFAISLSLPCETFACWTDAEYEVDCCFVNSPSAKNDYCCETIDDCKSTSFENCEYNNWRNECDCGQLCDYCYLSVALNDDVIKLDALRKFRDEILSQTPVGQEIIELYYQWSPAIIRGRGSGRSALSCEKTLRL